MIEHTGISVLVLTYNHEKYIERCLEGIFAQDYSGPVEVVISDDASRDATVELVRKFAEKAPEVSLKLNVNQKNIGAARNFEKALSRCTMPYVAFCEGDDFWILSKKLSLQAAVLDANPGTTLVYTNYSKANDAGEITVEKTLENPPDQFTFEDLMLSHGPSTNAVMLRRNVLDGPFPEGFYKVPNPDVFIFSPALLSGTAHCIDVSASTYRIHEGGIWSSLNPQEQKLIRLSTRLAVLKSLPRKRRYEFREIELKLERRFTAAMQKLSEVGDDLFTAYAMHLPAAKLRLMAWRKKLRGWKRAASGKRH